MDSIYQFPMTLRRRFDHLQERCSEYIQSLPEDWVSQVSSGKYINIEMSFKGTGVEQL